jgi:hypothetical protein
LARCLGIVAPLCLTAAVIATAIAIPTVLIGQRRDQELTRVGTGVIAELVAKADDQLTIRYRNPGTDAAVQARVVGSADRVVGRRYPAHADAAGHVRLDADPYNTIGSFGWLIAAWLGALLVTWPPIRWWRDARRAARHGRWYQAVGYTDHGNARIAAPADDSGAFVITCKTAPPANGPPQPLLVAGSREPRDAAAIAGSYASAGPASIVNHVLHRDDQVRLLPSRGVPGSGPEAMR